MAKLITDNLFSFKYDGIKHNEACTGKNIHADRNETVTSYSFEKGLTVTNILKTYPEFGAYEWVNWFENRSSEETGIISELYDGDFSCEIGRADKRKAVAFLPSQDDVTKIMSTEGSDWSLFEFYSRTDALMETKYPGNIFPGEEKKYSCADGRSSQGTAPFFNVQYKGNGVIFAIGWTGQWNCSISRTEDTVDIKTGLEDTNFRLLPGEKIRTSSVVVMPYEGSIIDSQNRWRRLSKKHFSLIGRPGKDDHMPLCGGLWGGMSTDGVLKRLEAIKKYDIPFEYMWMDAGWYGPDETPSPDEFEGNWAGYVGDWRVNTHHHPDGLLKVSEEIKKSGKKFLLWVEPERVIYRSPIIKEHPEYFTMFSRNDGSNCLLNLGNEEAWNYCFNTLCGIIEKLGVDFYRQDFNMNPLTYWRKNDAEDRKGITEIKHITGMYRLWDSLLEKYPSLMIDNCASGGRRLDIETLRRSVTLWRSDAACPSNYRSKIAQSHNVSYSLWIPYNGNGCGRVYDTYHMRSAYAGGLTTNFSYSENDEFGNDEGKMNWLRERCEEYLMLRPYYYGDIYPLTEISECDDVWSAVQFDIPEEGKGIVQIFRREKSPYPSAEFSLFGISAEKTYEFYDIDTKKKTVVSGRALAENGLSVSIPEKHSSRILMYKTIDG